MKLTELAKLVKGIFILIENNLIIEFAKSKAAEFDLSEKIIGSKIESIFNSKFIAQVNDAIKKMNAENFVEFESKIEFDKNKKWVKVILKKTENEKGNRGKYLLHIMDIDSFKTEQEYYKQIFDNAIMGIYKSTPHEGKHIVVNPELVRIYGYESKEDLLNSVTNISEQLYVDPERREKLLKYLEEEGQSFGFESKLFRKDGELIWISENAKAVRNSEGELEFIVGTVKDITDRKLYEEKLKQAKEDWERTFDAIDDIIIILDPNSEVRRLNKAALSYVKDKEDFFEGKKCSDLFQCQGDNCKDCPAEVTRKTKESHSAEIVNLKLGKTFLTTSSPIRDANNQFTGIVFVAKDITEEKRIKQESEYRLQQVLQADKLKSLGEMLAGVAHEINNPIGYIFYNLELLRDSWKNFEVKLLNIKNINLEEKGQILETKEIIDSIKNGADRINNVISSLKEYVKGNTGLKKMPINLNEIVEKAYNLIGANIKNSISNVEINLEPNLPDIKGSFQKLEQVFINLVMNAIQSSLNKRNSKIKIKTKRVERLKSVLLEVEDNGKGIDPEILDKLFEPFFTTRREIGGTGLGLSISYEIIREHNGLISVFSKKNIGSKFTVLLPFEDKLPKINPKIICVDDSRKMHNMLRTGFLKETDKFFLFLYEPAHLMDFMNDHPEIDTIFVNLKFGRFIVEILKKIYSKYPLTNFLMFSDASIIDKQIRQELSFAKFLPLPLNIENLKKEFDQLVRQKL